MVEHHRLPARQIYRAAWDCCAKNSPWTRVALGYTEPWKRVGVEIHALDVCEDPALAGCVACRNLDFAPPANFRVSSEEPTIPVVKRSL